MSLEIRGISKRYPNGVQAMNNISLSIGNNMFGLLAPAEQASAHASASLSARHRCAIDQQ